MADAQEGKVGFRVHSLSAVIIIALLGSSVCTFWAGIRAEEDENRDECGSTLGILALTIGSLFVLHLVTLFVSGCYQRRAAAMAVAKTPLEETPNGIYDAGSKSIETYYCFQLLLLTTFVLAIAELVLAIVLTVFAFDDTKEKCSPGDSDSTARILLCALILIWVPPLLRLVQILYSSGLFIWASLLGKEDDQVNQRHAFGSFASLVRFYMCCFCHCSNTYQETAAGVGLSAATLSFYKSHGIVSSDVVNGIAALSRMQRRRRRLRRKSKAKGDISNDPNAIAAIKSTAFYQTLAIASFTGMILDLAIYNILAPCIQLRRAGFYSFWKWTRERKKSPLVGENFFGGNLYAFHRYLSDGGNINVQLIGGSVYQKRPEHVGYFIAVSSERREIIVSIRGTESVSDVIFDAEVCSIRLKVQLEGSPKEFELTCSYNHGQGSLYVLKALGFKVRVIEVHLLEPSFAAELDESVNFFLVRLRENLKELSDNLERHGQPNIYDKLTAESSELKDYKLVITGYSLGGGIAALMTTILIGLDALPESQLFGVTFNSVPSVNAESRAITLDQITSWVFNDDIVSRMSKSNLEKLIREVIALRKERQNNFPPRFCCFVSRLICLCVCCSPAQSRSHYREIPRGDDAAGRGDDTDLEAMTPTARGGLDRRASSMSRAFLDSPRQIEAKTESELSAAPSNPLYIAGRVYHVSVATRRAPRYRVVEIDPVLELSDIVFSDTMLLDHLPWRLRKAFIALLNENTESKS